MADSPIKTIGTVTALIPEASTADEASERLDGQSGDTDFPMPSSKPWPLSEKLILSPRKR